MMTRIAAAATVLLAAARFGGAAEPAGPAAGVPELAPLGRYAGDWDFTMTIKPNAGLPRGASAKGPSRGEWVHGGRFLRQTWSAESTDGLPAMSGTTMMTYDPQQKA